MIDDEEIVHLYRTRVPVKSIAARYRVGTARVYRVLRARKIRLRSEEPPATTYSRATPQEIVQVIVLAVEGTPAEIDEFLQGHPAFALSTGLFRSTLEAHRADVEYLRSAPTPWERRERKAELLGQLLGRKA